MTCPSIIIAATGSGTGKTSITLGLTMAIRKRGLRVQTFKVGPDFLDPSYLAEASGRPCYNLDGWMTNRAYIQQLIKQACHNADIALIEGVMGLFDGASPSTPEGSTAEIATWLGSPVLLAVNVHGMSQSLAALVSGFAGFNPDVKIAGVIANHAGSARHTAWLGEALASRTLPPLVGAIPRGALPALRSRHLGLISADTDSFPAATRDSLATAAEKHINISTVLQLAGAAPPPPVHSATPTRPADTRHKTVPTQLAVAFDRAFHFYYPDNLAELERHGCAIIRFSPLSDATLPADIDALYLGGGYPEAFAEQLSGNPSMLQSIRAFAAANGAIYAECGGLMYLSNGIELPDGIRHPMLGILPAWTRLTPKLRTLGYAEVDLQTDSLWGKAGTKLRGHEFHYSELIDTPAPDTGWSAAYRVSFRRSDGEILEGFQKGRILASYVHLHTASQPAAAQHFAAFCKEKK